MIVKPPVCPRFGNSSAHKTNQPTDQQHFSPAPSHTQAATMSHAQTNNKRRIDDVTPENVLEILELWNKSRPSTIEEDLKEDNYTNVPTQAALFEALHKRLKMSTGTDARCSECDYLLSEVGVPSACDTDHGVCIHCCDLSLCGGCNELSCTICGGCSVCGAHQCGRNAVECSENCTDLTINQE